MFFTLDTKGTILAIIMALIMLVFGFLSYNILLGIFYVLAMAYFLILSALVTDAKKRYKKSIKLYQKSRGVSNVLANGAAPLIITIIIYIAGFSPLLLIAFIASIAAVTADKFSSELGVLDGTPRSILTFKKIEKGTSGGITLLGTASGFMGSLFISLSVFFVVLFYNISNPFLYFFIILVSGLFGTLVDSLFGVFEEKGIGNKFTTNFICSVAGAFLAALLIIYL
ncbi:MAG: DUF92 domain-containing protein [Candidatus Micrarchaeia archaeon]